MGRCWGVLLSTSLLDEAVCGFVDLAVLGVIRELHVGCFRPKADVLPIALSRVNMLKSE
jgi:hypothetical protein